MKQLSNVDIGVEVGCGLGYVTLALSEKSREVIAIEIDEEAVSKARMLLSSRMNVHLIEGDALSSLRNSSRVELIVSNPPYLPDDQEFKDLTIHGGPTGVEVTLRILDQSIPFIEAGGVVMIVSSTLSYLDRISGWAKSRRYLLRRVRSRRYFFEEILVLEIRKGDHGFTRGPSESA